MSEQDAAERIEQAADRLENVAERVESATGQPSSSEPRQRDRDYDEASIDSDLKKEPGVGGPV